MDLATLKKFLTRPESTHLEFKSSPKQFNAAFETVCAFLNSGGGIALLGVKNDRSIVGFTTSDNTRLQIN